jgi:Kelch motif
MNDFYACDLNTYTWTLIPPLGEVPSPRYFHSCAVHSNCMYVFGGYDGTQVRRCASPEKCVCALVCNMSLC